MPPGPPGSATGIGLDRLEFLFSVRFEIGVENSIAPGAKYTLLTGGEALVSPLGFIFVSHHQWRFDHWLRRSGFVLHRGKSWALLGKTQ